MKKIVLLLSLTLLLFGAHPKFIMPDEAFIPHAKVNDKMQIQADVKLAKNIYLYENKMNFAISDTQDEISIKEVLPPQSVAHHDEKVYLQSPSFVITLQKNSDIEDKRVIDFTLSYQGCSEDGLCYEPMSKTFTLTVDGSLITISQDTDALKQDVSETDAIANTISSGSIGLIILTFFGFGLLLALTPCTFPMIPIISGIIISQGEGLTTRKAFMLSVIYVAAMAIAYTIAGILAGLFGSNLQAMLQAPWAIFSFSAIFVALALSMFGFYELKPPSFLLSAASEERAHRGVVSVAAMGFLSTLIVGPCIAPPLAGALIYIGQTGDAFLGGAALFSLGIGMGLPLIVVGVSAGRFMPKPGHWMVMVNAIFGVMMLGVAIWMLERVMDVYITMLLWSILGIGFALYLGALAKEIHFFRKTMAIVIFVYAIALLVGTLGGSTNMAKPLEFFQMQTEKRTPEITHLNFTKVTSIKELDELLAKSIGKKVILDFYADWCVACKELEEITFSDENIRAKMNEFVLIQADITDNQEKQKDLSSKYGVFGPPAIIFFDENTEVMKSKTLIGFVKPADFLKHLNQIDAP